MTVSAPSVTRFRRSRPCPICGGGDDMPRGKGQRCSGFLSSDGRYAYCTREEHAGRADRQDTDPPTYRHILEGDCRCGSVHNPSRPANEPVATYDYVDAAGKLLYQVVRKPGKQFQQRRPDGNGGWVWQLGDTPRVLYRLPRVLAAAAVGETVYVVEGEKDVHTAERFGAVATCNPGGAGKWQPRYSEALAGATVVIVADNDEPGINHARQIAQTFPASNHATIVRAAEGKDISDHLGAGLTLDELVPLQNEDLTAQAAGGEPGPIPLIEWTKLSDIAMRSIVFVDYPLLQASAFHLLVGRKGMGKGTLLALNAARVTRGELGARRNVIWIGSEDSASIDIKPRIVAAGGDPERVLVVTRGWIQLPRDIDEISRAMTEFGDVGMLVVDPIGNHIAGKNSNSDGDIRDAIAQLNAIADLHECMVFGVRHLTEKDCAQGTLAGILGSSAFVQVPRAILAVVRDNEDPTVSHVQCVAGNRLPPGTPGRMLRIDGVLLDGLENEVTRATWIGDSAKDVGTMLAQSGTVTGHGPSKSAVARERILDILDGVTSMESDTLNALIADETGVTAKTAGNLRNQLKERGLIRVYPDKDDDGTIKRWLCARTLAPRPTKTTKPDPDHIPTAP